MAAFNKFNQFVEDIAKGFHDLSSHTLKVALTNSAPVATNTVLANITQLGAGNGYSTGGNTATLVSAVQTSGTFKLVLADVNFTASGGTIGPFQYFVLYNDSQTSPVKPLIGWWDYGSAISIADGNTHTLDLSATNGVLQLA